MSEKVPHKVETSGNVQQNERNNAKEYEKEGKHSQAIQTSLHFYRQKNDNQKETR